MNAASGPEDRNREDELDRIGRLLDQQMAGLPLHDPSVGAGGRAKDGEIITIEGVADNSASGAIVVDGGTALVGGMTSWPNEAYGKRVAVTGKVMRTSVAPNPVVGPNGEQSHGAHGSQVMLVNATWKLL